MLARERLRESSIPEADRSSMIENALGSVDRIYDYIAERLDAAAGQRPRDE